MTFKDLQKLVQTQSDPEYNQLLQRLKDKPFWIWNQKEHKQEDIKTKGNCCFNHIVGCQRKTIKKNQSLIMRSYSMNRILFSNSLVSNICVILSQRLHKPQGCRRFNCRYQVCCFFLRPSCRQYLTSL